MDVFVGEKGMCVTGLESGFWCNGASVELYLAVLRLTSEKWFFLRIKMWAPILYLVLIGGIGVCSNRMSAAALL